jgi:hypothetical protein
MHFKIANIDCKIRDEYMETKQNTIHLIIVLKRFLFCTIWVSIFKNILPSWTRRHDLKVIDINCCRGLIGGDGGFYATIKIPLESNNHKSI